MDKKKLGKAALITGAVLGTSFVVLNAIAKKKKPDSVYDNEPEQKNPLEGKNVVFVEDENDKENADGVKGHLVAVGDTEYVPSFYEKYFKRGIDVALSFGGLVALAPVMGAIALAIKIEDPGPVLFTQKRLGQNKQYFKLHKFRSMKMCTPHDVPTHMLDNPDQYITKVGKFIRAHSLDELPQIWDIFVGNMSVIGPRPGLWNQDLLTAERDKYGANDVKPGLTGWAQINGRDELEIPDKAKLDGEYVRKIGPAMDASVFLGSLHVFGKDDSVVEGGTGVIKKNDAIEKNTLPEVTNPERKRIAITGKGSYIGERFTEYLISLSNNYELTTIDTVGLDPTPSLFAKYDVVFHVAGIAHIKETKENKHLYYDVNRDLTIKVANSAKIAGVKQFIVLSSMSVYGKTTGHITKKTEPHPVNAYGDSKLQADVALQNLADENFRVAILRPPMVYGKDCKGNYQLLRKFALKSPVFPNYKNERSMVYIGNLCEFVKRVIDNNASGVFFPQNSEYVCTSTMVKEIGKLSGKTVIEPRIFNPVINIVPTNIVKKVFGNLTYEQVDCIDTFSFAESMAYSENDEKMLQFAIEPNYVDSIEGKRILFFAPAFFGYEYKIADKMRELGAQVDFYDERSVTSSRDRALLKISPELFAKKSYDYYERIIQENIDKDYDYVFIIKGEMTPESILEEFRTVFPKAKLCLYLYDSVANVPGITKKFKYFDTCHSFDPDDCKNYSALKFKPLFYADQFQKELCCDDECLFDICFLGTIHSDRFKIIKRIKEITDSLQLRSKWFLYLQSRFIYHFYKLTKLEFKSTNIQDFDYDKMSSEEIAEVVEKTKIVLDIHHPKQIGLTMRTIEMLGMNKKLITTNSTIKNYDFYNPNNICIVDREKVDIDLEFLNTPYQKIDKAIYESYSLENWIRTILY